MMTTQCGAFRVRIVNFRARDARTTLASTTASVGLAQPRPNKAEKPSVCLTVTPVSQSCQHRWKRDLLEMKAESSGTSKYIFISLNVPVFIHTSAQKAVV